MEDTALYYVTCAEELWSVRARTGAEVAVFGSRKDAIVHARQLAQAGGRPARVVVHFRDGSVHSELRFGTEAPCQTTRPAARRSAGAAGGGPGNGGGTRGGA
jgi:hypothetical protein